MARSSINVRRGKDKKEKDKDDKASMVQGPLPSLLPKVVALLEGCCVNIVFCITG